METEGHRPCKTGLHQSSAVDTRRHRVRTEAEGYKTKKIAEMLKALGSEKKALIVLSEVDAQVIASAANIPGVKTAQVNTLNVYDILNADKFIVVKDAVSKIEEVYA